MSDPIKTDESVLIDREDEAIREERWNEFVAWLKTTRPSVTLYRVAALMDGNTDPYYTTTEVQRRLSSFQETEGWEGVLSAMARAIRELKSQTWITRF